MDEKKECTALLKELREKYRYKEPDEFDTTENIETRKIRWIVTNCLSTVDRTIFLLYVECASLRKLGDTLNVSHSTIRPEVNRIKDLIKDKLIEMKDVINI